MNNSDQQPGTGAFDYFAESVRHFAANDLQPALEAARRATEAEPDEQLYADAARYLEKVQEAGENHIYAEPDAFAAFIGAGSNLPLYDSVRALLSERVGELAPERLLDIGSGEGTVIVPVVSKMEPPPHLTLVDPSIRLLKRAVDFALDQGLTVEAYPYPIEDVLPSASRYDVAAATWSLHNLAPATREQVFRMLAECTQRLFVAEFDDQSGVWEEPLAPERIRHIHDRYLAGGREYPGEEGRRVRHGFLMPVLYGYFARHDRRSTYEQPIERWEEELRAAGFVVTSRTLIYPYWWADAYLIEARV